MPAEPIVISNGAWGIITLILLALGFIITRRRQKSGRNFSPYNDTYLERIQQREKPTKVLAPSPVTPKMLEAPKTNETLLLNSTRPLIGVDTWMPAVTANYHTLIAGGTGTGKSVTARGLLNAYAQQGAQLILIDPHASADDYDGMQVIGAGRDYAAINTVLKALLEEMDARYKTRASVKGATFERLVIYVDEVPAIAENCPAWSEFLKRISAEARKVQMTLLILTQSVNTEDLGVNAQMRANFAVVALGRGMVIRAADILKVVYQERTAILETLKTERYPAATMLEGELVPIDMKPMKRLSERALPRWSVWSGLERGLEACLPSETALDEGFGQTDRQLDERRTRYKELIAAGYSRDRARDELGALDNNIWSACRRELGL